MAFDLVIQGGLLVDGTGSRPRPGDVAVERGRIAAIGTGLGPAREVIDATGQVVAPGFIDPHTHLDAQLCWDPSGSPSNLHGVTTVVLGLCGFGVAPCPAGGGDYLLRSLEVVEEIPFDSTSQGVDFQWGSWPDYFGFLGRQPLAVNAAGFVPHSALRYAVMGDRARADVATPADRDAMVATLAEALAAGALGLASSRGPNHKDAFGDPVPSRLADDAEIEALVGACAGRPWQINVETKFAADTAALSAEIDKYAGWTRSAGARLSWTPFHADPNQGSWREILDQNHRLNQSGVTVSPQVAVQPLSIVFRFDEFSFVVAVAGWREALEGFFELSREERLGRIAAPEFRAALRAAPEGGGAMFAPDYPRWILLHSPSHPEFVGGSLAALAEARGLHPADALCDALAADDLATLLQVPASNRDAEGVAALVGDDTTLIGLGDAGAHVTSINNFSYPTHLLASLVRDRGQVSLEDAVARMTSRPARFLGIPERGELREGYRADLVVIDMERLAPTACRLVNDLPGGAARLLQGADGYVATVVNGVVTLRNGEATGAAAGQLVRA